MTAAYDVAAIGAAIVDVISPADDAFLERQSLVKSAMTLIDQDRAVDLYAHMAPGLEASGGSAGNTAAGVASLGGSAAFVGKVANDQLGEVFAHDMRAGGVHFDTAPLTSGLATARSLINVTPDGHRTMATFLGASVALTASDAKEVVIKGARVTYLEGYLFDSEGGRQAFARASSLARDAGRKIALSISDVFVAERHREGLLAFMEADVDIVFANQAEAEALFQTASFEVASAELAKRVEIAAVTRSEAGSVVLTNSRTFAVPAIPVAQVVDTTGAGDQYAAGFLFGYARDLSMETCARLGSLAAAEVIGHYGPRPQVSLKTLAEEAGLLTAVTA